MLFRSMALAGHCAQTFERARLFAAEREARAAAEQLRVAPALRYEGKGRPTKRERREIERFKGE